MADSNEYSLQFGSISAAPSREAVKLRLDAEALRNRARRELLSRGRDPWRGGGLRVIPNDAADAEEYEYWDEM
jgi:hypothetical protein